MNMMNIKKWVLCFSFFLSTMLYAGVIFSENFDGIKDGTDLKDLNWTVKANEKQSLWKVEDGILKVTCFHNPYNGGYVEKEIPVIRKGTLDFDTNIAMEGKGNARGIALTVEIYNISTWFHDYCSDWRRYFPEGPSKRMEGYNIEPVGHRILTKIKKGKWNHYRIYFDADKGLVEYYCNDMTDPVYVDEDVPVLGRAEYEGGKIRLASMGFVNGPVTYGIDNIVLADAQTTGDTKASKKNTILIFQGISSNEYRVADALKKLKGYSIREYWVDILYSGVARNRFKMKKFPGSITMSRSKLIIFVDVPVGPNCLPNYFLSRLEEWVKEGGILITLGGPFSYGKGMYKGTILEKILPVNITGPWEVKKATSPLVIKPVESYLEKFTHQIKIDRPAVYYYHNLTMKEGVKVFITSEQGIPLWVYWNYGKGKVISFIGTVMGMTRENTVLFTEWTHWPELLREIVKWTLKRR